MLREPLADSNGLVDAKVGQWHVDVTPRQIDHCETARLRRVSRHVAGALAVPNEAEGSVPGRMHSRMLGSDRRYGRKASCSVRAVLSYLRQAVTRMPLAQASAPNRVVCRSAAPDAQRRP